MRVSEQSQAIGESMCWRLVDPLLASSPSGGLADPNFRASPLRDLGEVMMGQCHVLASLSRPRLCHAGLLLSCSVVESWISVEFRFLVRSCPRLCPACCRSCHSQRAKEPVACKHEDQKTPPPSGPDTNPRADRTQLFVLDSVW